MNISNVKVDPCKVIWDGVDLGLTDGDLSIAMEEKGVEITAHQEGTNVLDFIRTGKSVELTVPLKETTAAQLQARLELGGGATNDVAEVATLLCVADVSSSLHGATFPLIARDGTKYLFQLKTGALAAPVIPGWTVVQITISANDSANTVADAVSAAIDALAAFTAPNPAAATITITQATGGAVAAGSTAGNTGFTYTVTTPGSSTLSGWGKTKDFQGMLADSAKLVLHPVVKDDADFTEDFAFWKAYPMLNSITKSGENPQMAEITFKVFPDSAQADEVRLFAYGDHT